MGVLALNLLARGGGATAYLGGATAYLVDEMQNKARLSQLGLGKGLSRAWQKYDFF